MPLFPKVSGTSLDVQDIGALHRDTHAMLLSSESGLLLS